MSVDAPDSDGALRHTPPQSRFPHAQELDRKVALKFLKPGQGDHEARARLLREAQALARLTHPNVVTVHDVGTIGEEVFVAMEFVAGVTLRRWLDERARGWQEVVEVFGADQRVRVMDFGLARARISDVSQSLHSASTGHGQALTLELTRTGSLLGTPPYMAPEQWESADTDARSDQFSYSVALWEALYGERPFRGATLPALMLAITQGTSTPPSNPRRAPVWLRRLLERGISVEPAARWPSMFALLVALVSHGEREVGSARLLTLSKALAGLALTQLILSLFFPYNTADSGSSGVLVGDETYPASLLRYGPTLISCVLLLRTPYIHRLIGVLTVLAGLSEFSEGFTVYTPLVVGWFGSDYWRPLWSWDEIGLGSHLTISAGFFAMLAGALHCIDFRGWNEHLAAIWAARPSTRIVLAILALAVVVAALAAILAPPAAGDQRAAHPGGLQATLLSDPPVISE